jgi:hypothetical protein
MKRGRSTFGTVFSGGRAQEARREIMRARRRRVFM